MSFELSCRMTPQLLEMSRDRHARVSANGYTSSNFTMTWQVHLKYVNRLTNGGAEEQ